MKKIISILCLIVGVGCAGGKSPAEKIAWNFMDTYYVRTDPAAALPFTDRLAYEKVKQSVELIKSVTSQPGETNTRPQVSASIAAKNNNPSEEPFIFLVTIKPYESQEVQKKVMVRVRQMENQEWKVTQFSDEDVLKN